MRAGKRAALGRRAILAALASGCAARPPAPREAEPAAETQIAVAERGWHTDLCLSVADLTGPISALTRDFPGVRTLSFGFGERQFLLTRHPGFGEMLSAMLPSRSALLMTALNSPPAEAFGADNVVTLGVSRAGLTAATGFIWNSLETRDGVAVRLADGPYPGSVFFAASGTYDAFDTCNTWTATGLRVAGLPVNAGVIFAGQVMSQARSIVVRQARDLAARGAARGAATQQALAGWPALTGRAAPCRCCRSPSSQAV